MDGGWEKSSERWYSKARYALVEGAGDDTAGGKDLESLVGNGDGDGDGDGSSTMVYKEEEE
eukprot:scaffold185799_cov37-Attheya_sp.AAC.1